MQRTKLLYFTCLFICTFHSAVPLECYVCSEQDSNNEKCTKTIKTCNPEEDMCLTEIKWGTMPYWQAGADKQYYISKRCATANTCQKMIKKYSPYCTYIWYEDWKCAQCCAGDRCNYYIISGSSFASSNIVLLFTSVVTSVLVLASRNSS